MVFLGWILKNPRTFKFEFFSVASRLGEVIRFLDGVIRA